jgi:hypothetical protein
MIRIVPVTLFEVFPAIMHTAGTDAGISKNMTKPIIQVCIRSVLLQEFSHSMLAKCCTSYSQFVAVGYRQGQVYMHWTCTSNLRKHTSPITLILF